MQFLINDTFPDAPDQQLTIRGFIAFAQPLRGWEMRLPCAGVSRS